MSLWPYWTQGLIMSILMQEQPLEGTILSTMTQELKMTRGTARP